MICSKEKLLTKYVLKNYIFIYSLLVCLIFLLISFFIFNFFTTSESKWHTFFDVICLIITIYILCIVLPALKEAYTRTVVYPYKKLESKNKQLNKILDSLPVGIIGYQEGLGIYYANKTLLDLLECTVEDLEQLSHGLNIHFSDEVKKCTLTTPNGKVKTITGKFINIKDNNNNVIGYTYIANDVPHMFEDQTKLQQQEKYALIGQMGNGIVHEIKNYLASIKGYCDLLTFNMKSKSLRNYISKIEFIVSDVNGLVLKYLDLSKPDQCKSIPDILSLNELIESILYIIKSPSFLNEATLELDLSMEEKEILANESQIQHVIINLAKNAVEAMKGQKHPHLTIATQLKDNFMEIVVSDNGCGISKEDLKKIGSPFFTTKKTGTGLGLANCYKMIRDNHGQISVDSKEGRGTTFSVKFPVYEDGMLFEEANII